MTPKTKTASASVDQRAESVTMIPIAEVHAAGDNPRRALGDLAELTESIRANGIIEPLVVVAEGHDGYKVVVGHRRRAAGELAGLPWLPCIVRTYSEMARIRTMLVENLQREDLSPLEEAAGYQLLVDQGLSQRQIAEQVGRNQSHISKHLSLLQLPEKAREAVDAGRISKEDGFELTKLAEHPEAIEQAIQRSRSYGGVGQAAVAIADQLQSEAKRRATRERLEKEGKRVIGEATGSYMAGPYYPGARLEDLQRRAGKKFDAAAHEKLGCHGYFIGWDGEAIASCADANKHASPGKVRKDPEWDRLEKEREKSRRRDEELAARRQKHIQLLLAGKLGADARDHVVRQAIFIYEPDWDLAIQWLSIEQPEDFDEEVEVLISRWVAEAPSTRQLQAALAMVLESAEKRLGYHHSQKLDEPVRSEARQHFEFLTFSGYQLAPEEEARLVQREVRHCAHCKRELNEDEEGKYCGAHSYLANVPEGVDADTVAWLTHCPATDTNWKSALERARLGELRAAIAYFLKTPGTKTAFTKIQARIRALEKADVGAGEAAGAAPLSSAPSTSVDDSSSGQAAGGVLAPAHSAEVVDLPVGNFDEEDLPEPTPCPVCQKLACSHTIEEKASAAAAALQGARPELPPKRDPKACRECGCHGDCKGGCSWIDVDDVKGLLCSNHELVLA